MRGAPRMGGDSLPLADSRGGNSPPGVTEAGGGDSPAGVTRWAGIPRARRPAGRAFPGSTRSPGALPSETGVSGQERSREMAAQNFQMAGLWAPSRWRRASQGTWSCLSTAPRKMPVALEKNGAEAKEDGVRLTTPPKPPLGSGPWGAKVYGTLV